MDRDAINIAADTKHLFIILFMLNFEDKDKMKILQTGYNDIKELQSEEENDE